MKLSFDRVELTDAFGMVAGVAPSRTTKEILKNVDGGNCGKNGLRIDQEGHNARQKLRFDTN